MRPDLLALDADVLAELTNVGTARRAARELAAGARFTFTEQDGVVTAVDGDVTCVLGLGAFGTWTCTCAAGQNCRHLVRAVLQWQADAGRPAPGSGKKEADGASRVDGRDGSPEAVAQPHGTAIPGVDVLGAALGPAPDLAGVIASVTDTGARAHVQFFHPEHVAVRLLVGHDARYSRCECGVAGCHHATLARAVLDARPADGPALFATDADPFPLPIDLDVDWTAWLRRLLDLGLPAADELLGGVVRLATRAEAARLAHPASVLRELAEQLELRREHSARLSPLRQLELIGEFAGRWRALRGPTPQLPPVLVAGTPEREGRGEPTRLTGLGAEYREVGGWHELRAFVLDTGTTAVRTVTITRTDTEDVAHSPDELAQVRRGSARLLDFAAGRGLLPRSGWVGDELVLPRGRWTMGAVPELQVDPDLLAAGFALAATGDGGVPAALGPRRPADGVAVAGVEEVLEVACEGARVLARLRDQKGAEALLRLRPDIRAGGAAEELASVLVSGSVSALAGRWRPGVGNELPLVVPTAVWWAGGVLLPQLGLSVGDDVASAARIDLGGSLSDPWDAWWDEFADALGRLLLTGARRGSPQAVRALDDCAQRARSLGLARCVDLAAGLAGRLPYPDDRIGPFLDACVLLALRTRA